jgi:hypothetical protein
MPIHRLGQDLRSGKRSFIALHRKYWDENILETHHAASLFHGPKDVSIGLMRILPNLPAQ